MKSLCLRAAVFKTKKIMKIKSIIAFAGLLATAVFSTAFRAKPTSQAPIENIAQKEDFLQFLSQFKKVELPYSIGLKDLEGYQAYRTPAAKPAAKSSQKQTLKPTKFLPGSEASKFSRMGPPMLVAVARFYPNDQMVAVVYSSKLQFGGDMNMSYQLVLYDLNGNILSKQPDKKQAAKSFQLAYSSSENSMTCTIDAAGNIAQNTFENQWQKDVYEHGYDGNKIVDFKLKKTTGFKLDKSGNVSEVKYQAMASRARP